MILIPFWVTEKADGLVSRIGGEKGSGESDKKRWKEETLEKRILDGN